MKVMVDGTPIHVATGGRAHVAGRPFILFAHGAGGNHLFWILQTRAFAHDGWNVIAADMPGHGFSGGEPQKHIGAMARTLLGVLDACGASETVLCGHSMGGLIILEMARLAPSKVRALVFIGASASIAVNQQLITLGYGDREAAYRNMNSWGYGPAAHLAENTWPGANHTAAGIAIMNMNQPTALADGLSACAVYDKGAEAAQNYPGPALCVMGEYDRMTPARNGLVLAGMLKKATTHVIPRTGHTIHTEKPRELNAMIRAFLAGLPQAETV
jgi:pimeloyl-ACP methyl ester carboxylesterase